MAPKREELEQGLRDIIKATKELDLKLIGVSSGALHRRVGGYPGQSRGIPVCCDVMRQIMTEGDRIVSAPPEGSGATMMIQYSIANSSTDLAMEGA